MVRVSPLLLGWLATLLSARRALPHRRLLPLAHTHVPRAPPARAPLRLLARAADPDSPSDSPLLKRDYFSRREWNFTMADDVFIRYLDFRDAESLAREIQKKQPHKIDVGAVFNAQPSKHATVKNFAPEERELVFDIDMDAYDGTRTCCKGAKLCNRCWTFINAAVKVLDEALRDDFGFEHVLFVYSGRRGMHCWVADEAARCLDNIGRTAVAEYLSAAVPGGEAGGGDEPKEKGPTIAKLAESMTLPLHPALMCVRARTGARCFCACACGCCQFRRFHGAHARARWRE